MKTRLGWQRIDRFQFLIGSLVTVHKGRVQIDKAPFQFLIGSLVTSMMLVLIYFGYVFQFLIGSLVTQRNNVDSRGYYYSFNSS